jgi:hypothetical protein
MEECRKLSDLHLQRPGAAGNNFFAIETERLRAAHPGWSDRDIAYVVYGRQRAGLMPESQPVLPGLEQPKAAPQKAVRIKLSRPKSDPRRVQRALLAVAMILTGREPKQLTPALRKRAAGFAAHIIRLQP